MRKLYLFSFFILLIIGIVMIYSASSVWAEYKTGNEYYYLIRQLLFMGIGLIVFFIVYKFDYLLLKKYANVIFIISLVLLVLVLIPGIGIVRGGARSWIGIGDFSIQPAEFVKVAFIIFTAKVFSNYPGFMNKFKNLFFYLLIASIIFVLILLEPDFGTGMIFMLTILLMIFAANIKIRYLVVGALIGLIAVIVMIMVAPYRLERITAYLDPWSDPLGSGFQIIQSLYAISPASLFGYGLFNSKQKFFYLPEPQNDFIFAILVEELGLIGGMFLIALFLVIIIVGYKMSKKCDDLFGTYLLFGFTSLFALQVFINLSVVIGLIPVTGVTLPLISYGGSSLVITMFMIGVSANIMKTNSRRIKEEVLNKKSA